MRLATLLLISALGLHGQSSKQQALLVSQPSAGGGGGGSATFKGESHTNVDTTATTIATPGTLNVATGDLIVVVVGVNSNPTVTVSCGVDSLTEGKAFFGTDNYTAKLFYKQNATANAAAACTATFSFSQTFRAIAAANWSGVATTGGVLQSSCNSASCNTLATASTSRTSINVTTTTANTLLMGAGIDWDGISTHTGANGYTVRVDGGTPFLAEKSVNATGTYPSGNFTTGSSEQYVSFFVVFGLL